MTPRSGLKLARFAKNYASYPITKLISPALNISGSSDPVLKFYFTSVNWDGDVDELNIFYKTGPEATWTSLATISR